MTIIKEMDMIHEFKKITDFLLNIWQGKESKWMYTISLGRFPCVHIQHVDYPNAIVTYVWDMFPYNENILMHDLLKTKENAEVKNGNN